MTEGLKIHNLFLGGLSDSKYVNSPNRVPFMVGLDIFSEVGVMKANQKMKALPSSGKPTELDAKILTCTNGNVYYFSATSGKIWKLTTSNVWSLEYTTVPTFGSPNCLDAIEYAGYIYWTTECHVHRIRVSKAIDAAAWTADAESNWKNLMLDQQVSGFNTDPLGYLLPTAISEADEDKKEFQTIEDVLTALSIHVVTKGSADITVTVHDSANTLVGSVAIINANLNEGEENMFVFAPALDVDPDLTYHYHVTASVTGAYIGTQTGLVGTGTVTIASPGVWTKTSHGLTAGRQVYFRTTGALPTGITADTDYYVSATDLTANTFKIEDAPGGTIINTSGTQSGTHSIYAPIQSNSYLEIYTESNDRFHPFAETNGVLYVGDRNYVHQLEYDQRSGVHTFSYFALDIPRDYIVSAIHGYNTSLIVGSFAANEVNKAKAFWWNTYSTVSFSFEDTVPEPGIWSFFQQDENLFASAGTEGRIYQYIEGRLQFYKKISGNFDNDNQGYVKLNSHTFFNGRMMFAFSSTVGNPTYNGIYSLFSALPGYPFVFNIEYSTSERNGDDLVLNEIEFGSMTVRGRDLIISWKRGATVGVDVIDWANKHDEAQFRGGVIKPADEITQFTVRQLIVDYAELPDDTDIEISYYKNYEDTATVADTREDQARKLKIGVLSDTCMAIEPVVKLITNNNDTPKIFGLIVGFD